MKHFGYLVRRLFWLFLTVLILVTVLFITLLTYRPAPSPKEDTLLVEEKIDDWQPKNVLKAWDDGSMSPSVKKGFLLVSETSGQMGPNAEDPNNRFAGNNLSCTNCHLQYGIQAGSGSWVGVVKRFPQFRGRENRMGDLQDRINGCMERSMNGKKLPKDSEEIKAIIAYMDWLGEGLPKEKEKEYKGYPKIKIPEVKVDLTVGKAVYDKECVVCHGADGQGIKKPDATKGYLYPPLWGPDSFNNGAGMHRVITSAEFIKSNMPFGLATYKNPKLTDAEAYHVAGYINSFDRPVKSNTKEDFPDKKLKPVSTSYGPWLDTFSQEQHKYGPFPPIIAYYKEKYNIEKSK
ncbi:c-type cytochrome [Maribacter sp. PR1]|uniref:C-type cytochrome n=1 Tax=Maribacter cobaltidurans TaxID=1178778 RepID=A0ABU7IUR5_9FLAO|nr:MULTISPECIES: c-type cytochrome [Maribacter]MDC6389311.1 c-type cytochrome [Maribacter sp. PR1]MEE1976699.1 c-type cytochrome [Maribacter cobaltidurans]